MKNNISPNNPFVLKDSRTEALEDAYKLFMSILNEYSLENNLPSKHFDELREMIDEAYQDKKLNYFLELKLGSVSERVENMLNFALNSSPKKVDYTNLFYINHVNHLVTNE